MIWFKNAIIYQLKDLSWADSKNLTAFLSSAEFKPCAPSEKEKSGFIAPFSEDSQFFFESNHQLLMRFKKEIKLLPPAVLKLQLDEKIKAVEAESGKKVTKAEKTEIKEQLLLTLLPRAFSRFSYSWIWIDKSSNRLIIDTPSFNHAELILTTLRKSIGSLPIVPFSCESSIEQKMTNWILNPQTLTYFKLGEEAKLRDSLENIGIIQVKKQLLSSEEIHSFLNQGKLTQQLQLVDEERASFVLHNDLTLKKIQFVPELIESHHEFLTSEKTEKQKADFGLMALVLGKIIEQVSENV